MEDEELGKIRAKKLDEMQRRASRSEEKKAAGQALAEPVVVTDASFNDFIKNHPLVVVDCWAAWCPPCRMIAPIIEELAKDYAGKIVFGKLNVDENQKTAGEFGIMSIPTMLVFRDGKIVDRIIGAMPRKALESKITQHI
jgi:thioredoxin 1